MSEGSKEGTGGGSAENPEGRSVKGVIDIDAPPERVWRALTEAKELERWFPLDATVEPGEGGRIRMSWGNELDAWSDIRIWKPPKHLRISWSWGGGPAQITDYYLDGRGDRTVVRVVTSGFPEDSSWDDMVEGTRLGWVFELWQLKHYLERHAGKDRRAAYIRRRVSLTRPEAWRRLSEGIDFGDSTTEIFDRSPPWQLAGVSTQPREGMIRFTIDPTHTDPARRDVTVWVCAWGDTAAAVDEASARWRAELDRLFPEGEPIEAGT